MKSKILVLYTMEGCPHCEDLKESLMFEGIDFIERDIDENDEEYASFVIANDKNEFVPAFMVFEVDNSIVSNPRSFVPDRDFQTISEAAEIIKAQING